MSTRSRGFDVDRPGFCVFVSWRDLCHRGLVRARGPMVRVGSPVPSRPVPEKGKGPRLLALRRDPPGTGASRPGASYVARIADEGGTRSGDVHRTE